MPTITPFNPAAGLGSLLDQLSAPASGISAIAIQLHPSANRAVNLFSGFGAPQGAGGLGIADGLLLTSG